MGRKVVPAILLTVLVAAVTGRASDPKAAVKGVGGSLLCQCGCNQTVTGCNHYVCSSRTEMQAQIEKEVAAGRKETAILQDFVLRYGVKVLATPPPHGFNLTVWVLPALGLVAGLVVVIAVTRRWRRPVPEPSAAFPAAPLDPKLRAALEEEMKASGLGT